jgi:hypothetical protein
MAVSTVAHADAIATRGTIGVTRLVISGGVTAGLFLVFCWVGAFLPISSPTHAYISLFTNAEITSGRALLEGGIWATLFGGLISGLFGLVHNATAAPGRR